MKLHHLGEFFKQKKRSYKEDAHALKAGIQYLANRTPRGSNEPIGAYSERLARQNQQIIDAMFEQIDELTERYLAECDSHANLIEFCALNDMKHMES